MLPPDELRKRFRSLISRYTAPCLFMLSLLFVLPVSVAYADEITDCIERKINQFKSPKSFSQSGRVECPAADLVDFPPRERTHDRSGAVTFTAPDGHVVSNTGINSVTLSMSSTSNGSNGGVTISPDGKTVSAPISCRGKNLTQGRAWHEVVLSGFIEKRPDQNELIEMTLECARCEGVC